ncbi:hypothetical protein GCM10020254_38540 [Streptomyces goshikiensis]
MVVGRLEGARYGVRGVRGAPAVFAAAARVAGALRVEAVRTLARSTTALHISTRLVLPAPAPRPPRHAA